MIRRHPIFVSLLGLLAVILAYFTTSKQLAAFVEDAYYLHFERRFVQHRDALKPKDGERLFGMYRPELPWDYTRFYGVGKALSVDPRIVSFYQAWGIGSAYEFKTEAIARALTQGLIPLITWEPWLSAFGEEKRYRTQWLFETSIGWHVRRLHSYLGERRG